MKTWYSINKKKQRNYIVIKINKNRKNKETIL